MADDNQGQDQTQTDQSEEQTSQNDQEQSAYKVFETEDDYKQAQDKFFRGAYNEGKQKMFKDTVQTAQEKLGIEGDFETVEDVFQQAASRLNGSSDEPEGEQTNKEAEELRDKLQDLQGQLEEKENQIREKEIDGTLDNSLNNLKRENDVPIKDNHLKKIFRDEHKIKMDDQGNKFVQRPDGTPVLDGEGNRKDVSDVFADYAKKNGYAQPKAEGLGGGTGSGATGEKPKYSDFKEKIGSQKQEERKQAEEIYKKAQEHGWAQGDSPKDAMRFNS